MAARHKHKKAVPFPIMEQVPPFFMLLLLQCPDEFLDLRALQKRRQGIHDLLVILERTLLLSMIFILKLSKLSPPEYLA